MLYQTEIALLVRGPRNPLIRSLEILLIEYSLILSLCHLAIPFRDREFLNHESRDFESYCSRAPSLPLFNMKNNFSKIAKISFLVSKPGFLPLNFYS